jgi:hypothetical protein
VNHPLATDCCWRMALDHPARVAEVWHSSWHTLPVLHNWGGPLAWWLSLRPADGADRRQRLPRIRKGRLARRPDDVGADRGRRRPRRSCGRAYGGLRGRDVTGPAAAGGRAGCVGRGRVAAHRIRRRPPGGDVRSGGLPGGRRPLVGWRTTRCGYRRSVRDPVSRRDRLDCGRWPPSGRTRAPLSSVPRDVRLPIAAACVPPFRRRRRGA